MEVLYADREPCPVCGHPTGDCVGEAVPFHIIGSSSFPITKQEVMFRVTDDVFEEIRASEFTTIRVLLAHAGEYIPESKARQLGLL